MLMYKNLLLSLKMREALAWVGSTAQQQGDTESAQKAHDLFEMLSAEEEVTVHVTVVAALCHACDDYRERGELDKVAKIEALIKALKGGHQRVITGTLAFGGPRLKEQLEQVGLTLIKK